MQALRTVPRQAGNDRPGFETRSKHEAAALKPLFESGSHFVGHSYGGIVALYLAAAAPQRILSLTVIEPPAFGLTGAPEAVKLRAAFQELWADGPREPFEFFHLFASLVGERPWPRPPLPPAMEAGVRALMGERAVWEARPDLGALAQAPFPVLVVSGGHAPEFETVCDAIASRTHAQRAVIRGARHSVPRVGQPFNDLLERFWLDREKPPKRLRRGNTDENPLLVRLALMLYRTIRHAEHLSLSHLLIPACLHLGH